MIRSAMAIAGALLVAAAMPSMAGLAAGATPTAATTPAAVGASLHRELTTYLNAYRGVEHISAVSLAVTFRDSRPGIGMSIGNAPYGCGPTISPYALWQIGSNTKAFGVNSASLTDNTAALDTSLYQTLHEAGLS